MLSFYLNAYWMRSAWYRPSFASDMHYSVLFQSTTPSGNGRCDDLRNASTSSLQPPVDEVTEEKHIITTNSKRSSPACTTCHDSLGGVSTSDTLPDLDGLRAWACSTMDSLPELGDFDDSPASEALHLEIDGFEFDPNVLKCELINAANLLCEAQSANRSLQDELEAEREKYRNACVRLEAVENHATSTMEQLLEVSERSKEQTETCASCRAALRCEQECEEIQKTIREAGQVETWKPGNFKFVKVLEKAPRNEGVVELMVEVGEGGDDGHHVAVKRMPVSRTSRGHDMFLRERAGETENPWVDIGVAKYLNQIGYPYVSKLIGVFQDSSDTFIVSSFATEGDLFNWLSRGDLPTPGIEREGVVRPLLEQVTAAISELHNVGIAHCDLSLENILLTREDSQLALKLTDFSMAVVGKQSLVGPRGKASYQAPEMHSGLLCSPFKYDTFSLGVAMFVMATGSYPWMSTMPGGCKKFKYAQVHGFRAHLKKLKQDLFSPAFTALLAMLLVFEPSRRGDITQISGSAWWTSEGQTESPHL